MRRPPEGFNYELFLDENGQKISKSKGNGLTIDQWLTYAPTESLGLYMFQKPKTAKKLYFDVIPKAVDEYYTFLAAYPRQDWKERLGNPVWHMHNGNPPDDRPAGAVRAAAQPGQRVERAEQGRAVGLHLALCAGRDAATHPELDRLAGYAIRYFDDFVKPAKVYPRAGRGRAGGAGETRRRAGGAAGRRRRRGDPERRRSTSRARSSAIRTMPSKARKAGQASRSPSSR